MASGKSLESNPVHTVKFLPSYNDKGDPIMLRSREKDARREACAKLDCTPKRLRKLLKRWRREHAAQS